MAMFGKFSVASSFAVLYVYASELMPTIVRAEAMGIASFVAGLGLLIFPYILQMVIDSIMCNNLSHRHGGEPKCLGHQKIVKIGLIHRFGVRPAPQGTSRASG